MNLELKTYLDSIGMKYVLHKHKAFFKYDDGKFLRETIRGMHTKSLFLKDGKCHFYLICINGDKRLDMKTITKLINAGKLRFGSAEELMQELHTTPGSVSIFGVLHAKKTDLILDKEIWDSETVCFHPEINTETLEIMHDDFQKFYSLVAAKKEIAELIARRN
jgi:Ala-tRNA(Pro) deacylase